MSVYERYDEALKLAVISEYKSGLVSKRALARKYGIKSGYTITLWIRKLAEENSGSSAMDYSKSEKKDLIKRIKELERQLEDEQIRSLGYSKMIDIAEEQLNISIRKKPGTKQSKK